MVKTFLTFLMTSGFYSTVTAIIFFPYSKIKLNSFIFFIYCNKIFWDFML
uniref:Uncharacterized protein n=1 Tax=Rhizophora mucronata TaxID=61149 RepID=A0A2P2Q758_RHIMU